MTAGTSRRNLYHFDRGGLCKNTYLFTSRVGKDVIDWHVCQRSKGHGGWCECWCACLFDDYGIVATQEVLPQMEDTRRYGRH